MYGLSWIEIIYWGSTIIGGTLFILRTIMMLVGGSLDLGDGDFDADVDMDGDLSMDGDHLDTDPDSDFSFKLLSMQGFTAFFMMFGLVGLTLLKANVAVLLTILGGGIAGTFAVWVISLLFSQMKRLQSDGTLQIENAIGKSGSVYLNIPAKGTGQVQVTVQGGLKIFDAFSKNGQRITTGEKISVTGTVDNKTLIVEKIQ
jgi:membrane protein implicated in regulation of membrane protease activity